MHSSLIQAWRLGTTAIKQEQLLRVRSLCKHAYTARAALAQPCLLAERKTYPTHPHHTAGASLLLAMLLLKRTGHCMTFSRPGHCKQGMCLLTSACFFKKPALLICTASPPCGFEIPAGSSWRHKVLDLATSKTMIALTSTQPSRLQVLVEPVPNGVRPHGNVSKASGVGSEGTEEVSACHLHGRKSVLSEARKLGKEATLPILCDCQSERP